MPLLGPQPFEVQRSLSRNLVLSAYIQASSGANGTPISDANMTRLQRFDVSGVAEFMQTRRTDKAYAGKGTEFATSSQVTSWDCKFTMKGELDDWIMGFLFAHALATDSCVATTVDEVTTYTHSMVFSNSFNSQAPMTTFYLEDTTDLMRELCDMAMVDLTITIPKGGTITFEANFAGTGIVIDPYSLDLPDLSNPTYMLAEDTGVGLSNIGTDVLRSISGRLEQATIKIQTGASSWKAPGDEGFGIFMRQGIRKFSVSATIAAQDSDDIETLLVTDTAQQLRFMTVPQGTTNLSLEILMANMKLKSAKMGSEADMTIWQIDGDEETIMESSPGANDPIAVTIVNSHPAYLQVDAAGVNAFPGYLLET